MNRNDGPRPTSACCFAMCQTPAIMRVRTKTGWANVCQAHDVELKTREAIEWMETLGLERQHGESMRDWMGRTLAHFKVRKSGGIVAALPALEAAVRKADPVPPMPEQVAEFYPWQEPPAFDAELETL